MSGTTLNDIAGVQELPVGELPIQEQYPVEEEQTEGRGSEFFKTILTAETGSGSISEYKDHPMNFTNSKAFAHVLRGLTGIFGSLNLAIVDIGVGAFQFLKEKR
jgi:hypothetical protein